MRASNPIINSCTKNQISNKFIAVNLGNAITLSEEETQLYFNFNKDMMNNGRD